MAEEIRVVWAVNSMRCILFVCLGPIATPHRIEIVVYSIWIEMFHFIIHSLPIHLWTNWSQIEVEEEDHHV